MLMPSVQLLGFMDRFCVSMSIDAGRPKSKSKSSTLCTWRKIENLMMNNRKKRNKHHPLRPRNSSTTPHWGAQTGIVGIT